MQRYIVQCLVGGRLQSRIVIAEPRALEKKDLWTMLAALDEFTPRIGDHGHRSIMIYHVCADEGVFACLFKRLHGLLYQGFDENTDEGTEQLLKCWVAVAEVLTMYATVGFVSRPCFGLSLWICEGGVAVA